MQAVATSDRKGSTIVITVGSLEEARDLRVNGIRFGGSRYQTEHYWELGPDTICPRCCGIGHRSFKACGDRVPKCYICAGPHEGADHTCTVTTCTVKAGKECLHMPAKCGNCGKNHPATWAGCPERRSARSKSAKPQEAVEDQEPSQQVCDSEGPSGPQDTDQTGEQMTIQSSLSIGTGTPIRSSFRQWSSSAPSSPRTPQEQMMGVGSATPMGMPGTGPIPPGIECW
jgi:hypothetical protein